MTIFEFMEMRSATADAYGIMDPRARLGAVSLAVSDLGGQIDFYRDKLGFALHWKNGGKAGLGAGGTDLLELVELPGARRRAGTTGLYHFAILLPGRRDLARAIARLIERDWENHPTDHVMTKATYLMDPEGQEIEVYADTPEDGFFGFEDGEFIARRSDGSASDGREALDLKTLFGELETGADLEEGLPAGTRIGHVHLYVRDVPESLAFYAGVLGFGNRGYAPSMRMAMVSAGGYHHHVGLNTWMGEGAPAPPAGSLGMRHFTLVVPVEEQYRIAARAREAGARIESKEGGTLIRDPSGNAILVASGEPAPA
jgi:catechol 2,3-dioxygenase